MCLAENVYHVACGCWQGHHITHPCYKQASTPRSRPPNDSPGVDDECPDLSCSGVFRQAGKCLVCRRREAQQQSVFPLPIPPPTPPPSPSPPPRPQPSHTRAARRGDDEDENGDEYENQRVRVALLAEVLRRAVDVRGDGVGGSFRSESNTASRSHFLQDCDDNTSHGSITSDTADGGTYFIKDSEETFETKSTAWHQH
ncbi:hypothetical protein HER10_EVM0006897 [Colletotrichum scovillei]|uniref:uncharacterized protein n=1 Tax=Colletotrichum scovillei TaxID=1209932 RepID=UPI0015C3B891|nr:uncharacterized protein HER10_EVM0006897 [Colletotrichum scovillei]KAF4785499.1 hypothetical protein HER10_EVM0006897 [Colletotrichum scovillei]